MRLPKLLLLTLTFCNLVFHLDATRCPKGHKIKLDGGCAVCPDGNYQPEENDSQHCKPCTKCDSRYASLVKQACTRETNTKCQCRAGFVPREGDSASCKCDVGFGLVNYKECFECKHGYFTTTINTVCRKWKECTSGVNRTGTRTSDVICNNVSDNVKNIIMHLTSLRPTEETQTQSTRAKTTTTASPDHTGKTVEKKNVTPSSDTGNKIGMALLIFGIVGLLMLTTVTCKLHISPCMQRKSAMPPKDSCRRPVEESGDGSLSSLKLNQEEA